MDPLVGTTLSGRIAVVTVNHPPVNALSPGVPEGIRDAVGSAGSDPNVQAIVVMGSGSTFVAGADIKEFARIVAGERPPLNLAEILLEIEDSQKPVVMAIHGTAFGGGLELAMAGHYRVAVPSAKVGQPEVNLGLIPGAAGTQRLPRLAGVEKALEMCAFGQPAPAQEALAWGIIDRVIEGDLLPGAIAFAEEIARNPIARTRDRNEKLKVADPGIYGAMRDKARKTMRGRNAPQAAIEAVEAATRLPFDEGCRFERELFNKCLRSAESRALIHVFFGEREVAKIPGLSKNVKPAAVAHAAVIGAAGTMGPGIAMTYADAGIPVILKDATQEAVERGMEAIRKDYAGSVAEGRLSEKEMESRLALISPQTNYDGFDAADVITEAVFEQMEAKKQVFAEIGKIAKPGCILASSTSTLDLDEIASATSRPESVVGHHFFSPAHMTRLVEVVRGRATSDWVLASSMALAKRLKKVAVLAGNAPGFIGDRMLHPYIRESQFLVEEGASVEDVNSALYDFGMAMGPLAMCDLMGLDIGYRMHRDSASRTKPGVRLPLAIPLLFKAGRLGQNNGRGFSRYADGRQAPDPDVTQVIHAAAREAGIEQRIISREEIVDRCILALVNEGARVLEAGTAMRAVDIDIVYINGYGFPSWRGGPMFYAGEIGLNRVLGRIEEFRARHGDDLWAPAPLLVSLAAEGRTFSDLDKAKSE
jgi:3-hydroxyacyl-CoA dehydrogenase